MKLYVGLTNAYHTHIQTFHPECPNRRIRNWSQEKRDSIAHDVLSRIHTHTEIPTEEIEYLGIDNNLTVELRVSADNRSSIRDSILQCKLNCDKIEVSC